MKSVIGKCSHCGGMVSIDDAHMSAQPPVARCESCGATRKKVLPVIEMNESAKKELLLG